VTKTELSPLIAAYDLAQVLDQPNVKIIDASWRMPNHEGVTAQQHYEEQRIPGAVFFDIDTIADQSSPLPHMAPAHESFATAMQALGISRHDKIVIYNDAGIFSGPRVWWTFRAMGHPQVQILDGGYPKWLSAGYPVSRDPAPAPALSKSSYPIVQGVSPRPQHFIDAKAIAQAPKRKIPILDARPLARFQGHAPEPKPSLRRGHMPGATSLPFTALINQDGTFKSKEELIKIFNNLNISPKTGAYTSCGSGITAAIINLALEIAHYPQQGLYDGAWAEWGNPDNALDDFPVET